MRLLLSQLEDKNGYTSGKFLTLVISIAFPYGMAPISVPVRASQRSCPIVGYIDITKNV